MTSSGLCLQDLFPKISLHLLRADLILPVWFGRTWQNKQAVN